MPNNTSPRAAVRTDSDVESAQSGSWPTWLMAAASGAAFAGGLFVSWAVFSGPTIASGETIAPPDVSALTARVEQLEAIVDSLKSVQDLKPRSIQAATIKTEALVARTIGVVDDKDRERITVSCLLGSPHLRIRREDDTTALSLTEHGGEAAITLFDTTDKPRIEVVTKKDGTAVVRMVDAKGKVRVGMVSTPDNEAEFIRFDKFGNAKTVQ